MSQVPAQRQVSAWNLANALTLGRVGLVPVFGVLLLHDGGRSTAYRLLAAAVFVLASVTDRIDGELARSRDTVTDFGKVSDPIADKALMGMGLIGLSLIGELWWWVSIVVLARETLITAMRFAVIRHGVLPASRGGKVKTVLQALSLGLYVLPLTGPLRVVAAVVMAAAVGTTVVTGVDYVVRARRMRRGSARTLARQRARRPVPKEELPGTLRERAIQAMGEDRDPQLPLTADRPWLSSPRGGGTSEGPRVE